MKTKPSQRSLELVETAAREAWGVTLEEISGTNKTQPGCFQRALCICVLAEEMGFTQRAACKALGTTSYGYLYMRDGVTKKLSEQVFYRRLATRFLERLG